MTSKPPPSTAAPAGVPSGGNGKYILLVLLLVGAVVAIVAYKKCGAGDGPTGPVPSVSASLPPPPRSKIDDDIPPPPPPEPSADAASPPKPNNTTYTASNGCEAKVCGGHSTPDLDAALAARARMSRRCYNNALAADNTLQGKMNISLRIGSNGAVCSASITSNDLGSQSVAACVQNAFRSSGFPSPAGGCVEANVPMNFVQQH